MRISVFTGRLEDPQRATHVGEAAAIAAHHGAEMLVLSGYSLGRGRNEKAAVQRIADEAGVSVLGEAWDTFYFRPNQDPLGPFIQRFHQGTKATHSTVLRVTEEFVERKRVIRAGGKDVGVLLCGENNILRNVRQQDSDPQPRHPDLQWFFVYDVLVNPAHTSMGQWNLLHKRFAYFSQEGRTVLYCTNNGTPGRPPRRSWRTALCIYQDGEKKAMGDFADGIEEAWTYTAEDWRLATVDIP